MSTLHSLVDDWLERSTDDEPRTVRPGYHRGFKLPRPTAADLCIGFHVDRLGAGLHHLALWAVDEDCERVRDDRGNAYSVHGPIDLGNLVERIDQLTSNIGDAIDAIVAKHEDAYHGSDEAMRATHPREV